MGDLINLKKFKKRVEREQADAKAAVNRAKFGRSKTTKTREAAATERANGLLDQHFLDDGKNS